MQEAELGKRASYALSPRVVVSANGPVFVGLWNKVLLAIDPISNTELWRREGIHQPLAVAGHQLLAWSDNYDKPDTLQVLDIADGRGLSELIVPRGRSRYALDVRLESWNGTVAVVARRRLLPLCNRPRSWCEQERRRPPDHHLLTWNPGRGTLTDFVGVELSRQPYWIHEWRADGVSYVLEDLSKALPGEPAATLKVPSDLRLSEDGRHLLRRETKARVLYELATRQPVASFPLDLDLSAKFIIRGQLLLSVRPAPSRPTFEYVEALTARRLDAPTTIVWSYEVRGTRTSK